MSLSSSAMLSLLPQPVQPVPGESFDDRVLLLLAAVAAADGRLSYRGYQTAQEACRNIFGDRALHAELQAKLHYALLHPPTDPAKLLAETARRSQEQNIPRPTLDALLHALALFTDPDMPGDGKACAIARRAQEIFKPADVDTEPVPSLFTLKARIIRWFREATCPPRLKNAADHTSGVRIFEADMERATAELDALVRSLNDEELRNELHAFRKLIRAHPFKIAVVGERKRGKSSLINALLGRILSPVGESAPETAVGITFRYAAEPEYTVRFLDAPQFARLQAYLNAEEGNRLLSRKIERIRQGVADGTFVPGKLLTSFTRLEETDDYTRVGGRFSSFVARVCLGMPLPFLSEGLELTDTPGLNDTDRFHDYLAYEESLEADCLLFVMDARDPGSHSELGLLRRLARTGRSVTVIGVLTNPDRLESVSGLERAREQARTVLEEACRLSPHVQPIGVTAINARQAMERRCKGEPVPGEFDRLLTLLDEAAQTDAGKVAYRLKVAENYARLSSQIRKRLQSDAESRLAALPGPEVLAMLEAHAGQLAEATRLSLEQARQVVEAAAEDMEAWERETGRSLVRFEETLVLRLMEAVNAKVAALGRQFAKESVWKKFDAEEARDIARCAVDAFLQEQHEVFQSWEKKIRLFSERMNECSGRLANASASVAGLDSGAVELMFSQSGKATHFLVQTHHYMKNIAVFATGAAVGRASALSPLTLLVSAGNVLALAITSPMLAAVAAAVAGTAGAIYHLGREDKRKAAFLERRRKEAELYSRRIAEALREELDKARAELGKAYEAEVRCGFTPALESLFYQSVHLRLFLETMERIRLDTGRYSEDVQLRLNTIREALAPEKSKFRIQRRN